MQGYKIFDSKWQCRGLQYRVGETVRHEGAVVPCKSGLHFCATALACTNYYSLTPTNRYALVRAASPVQLNDKWVTAELHVVREIPYEEFRAMCTGNLCTWHANGQLWTECHYHAGVLEGSSRTWYADGQLATDHTYHAGKNEGTSRNWHANGQLATDHTYRAGKLEGTSRS